MAPGFLSEQDSSQAEDLVVWGCLGSDAPR